MTYVDDLWEPNDREPTEPDMDDEPARTGPVTAADIAEHLTGSDNDYTEALDGWPGLHAVGNVLHIKVTPAGDRDNPVYFHAVIKPGKYEGEPPA